MSVGDKIKELRMKNKLTQIQLARLSELTPAAISQYESNIRVPSIEAIKKIADALNVSVDNLLGNETAGDEETKIKESLFRTYSNLNDDDKKSLDSYLKFLASKSKK